MHLYVNLSDQHTVTVGASPSIAPGASGILAYSAAVQDLIDRHIIALDESEASPSTAAQLKRWLDDHGIPYARSAKLAELRDAYAGAIQGGDDGGNG